MIRRILLAGLAAAFAAVPVGCRHCCKRTGRDLPPPPPGGSLIPPPPGGLPSTPPPTGSPSPDLPPPNIPDTTRQFRPDAVRPDSGGSGPKLLLPDPLPPATSSARSGGDAAATRGGDLPPRQTAPTGRGESSVGGVPGFTVVKPGLAAGRKPAVEGFDAVKAAGYRTAIYLYAPGDDVSATKDLAEKTGLTFVGVPVSPGTLKASFERFRDTVGDQANRPAFVFDDTGVRAGSMWYLYFRTVDQFGDDAARVRAAPLGLTDTGDEATKYWVAIQDYLAKR